MQEEHQPVRLDPQIKIVWRIHSLCFMIVLLSLSVACFFFFPFIFNIIKIPLIIFIVITAITGLIVSPYLTYKFASFIQTEESVEIRSGAFIRRRTLIPLVRVQHVNHIQGPIMSLFGLSKLVIATASDSFGLEGISSKKAYDLAEQVTAAAEAAREDL